MQSRRDLTQGAVFPHILRMAVPMMLGLTAHMLLNIVDGIFVGRLGLAESLAVLNYGFPFYYLCFAFFNGLAAGSTSVLARYIGAKKEQEASGTLAAILYLSLLVLLLVALIFPFIFPLYLDLQQASGRSGALAQTYVGLMLLGLPFTVVSLLLGSGMRAEGNMRTLMNGLMIGMLTNLVLDPFFIFENFQFGIQWSGLGWGVGGAAVASVLAAIVTTLYIGSVYLRGETLIRWQWKTSFRYGAGVREMFGIGLPSILSQGLIGLSLIAMTRIARVFGESATAAIGIGTRLDTLAVFPALSIMAAVVSLVGQNYGAGKMERVRETVKTGLLTAFLFLLVLGQVVNLCKGPLIGLFEPDSDTFSSASHYMSFLCYSYGFVGLGVVSSGAFQGLGRGMPFLLITSMRLLVLTIPTAFLLSRFGFGEKGLHYAPLVGSLFTGCTAATWILWTTRSLPGTPTISTKSASSSETQTIEKTS